VAQGVGSLFANRRAARHRYVFETRLKAARQAPDRAQARSRAAAHSERATRGELQQVVDAARAHRAARPRTMRTRTRSDFFETLARVALRGRLETVATGALKHFVTGWNASLLCQGAAACEE
jgi:hypothetical protein